MALLLALAAFPLVACHGSTAPAESEAPADTTGGNEAPAEEGTAERPTLSAEACEAQGGELVGDIGDGATQRPDYVCPAGAPPVANVALGVEGSVCCMP